MPTYRQTTRVGPCWHCRAATVQACEACENFVCEMCEKTHNDYPTPELIVNSKPGG